LVKAAFVAVVIAIVLWGGFLLIAPVYTTIRHWYCNESPFQLQCAPDEFWQRRGKDTVPPASSRDPAKSSQAAPTASASAPLPDLIKAGQAHMWIATITEGPDLNDDVRGRVPLSLSSDSVITAKAAIMKLRMPGRSPTSPDDPTDMVFTGNCQPENRTEAKDDSYCEGEGHQTSSATRYRFRGLFNSAGALFQVRVPHPSKDWVHVFNIQVVKR
jgi:hypothetical protein